MYMQADTTPKNQRLSIAELAAYDDLLTDVLVDKVRKPGPLPMQLLTRMAGLLLDEHQEEPYEV